MSGFYCFCCVCLVTYGMLFMVCYAFIAFSPDHTRGGTNSYDNIF